MSLPREPRQKMINMMYLVLTALLALNVSAEILNAFKTVNKSLENTNATVNTSTSTIMASLEDKTKKAETAERANIWFPRAKEAQRLSKDMYDHIQGLKNEILTKAGGNPNDPNKSFKEDNLDIATRMMVDKGGGKELLKRLTEYKKNLLGIHTSIDSAFKTTLSINLDPPLAKKKKSWEYAYFHMVPTVAALTILSKFQNDVKTSENNVVSFCHEQVGKVEIVFDSYAAIVGQNSNYLMPGQELEIKAGVGAFSKASLPKISIGGSMRPLEPEGYALFKTQAGGMGNHTVPVSITYFNQITGKEETKEVNVEYTVGSANASIALDKMNVLYIGVNNPVTISASGGGDDKVVASISGGGGSIQKQGGGKYVVRVTQQGDARITVTVDGKVVGASDFRVRQIPGSQATVGGFASGENVPAATFRAQGGVAAWIKDFPFDLKYTVTSFTISTDSDQGDIEEANCTGNAWSPKAAQIIRDHVKQGKTVYIDNIRVLGEDGQNKKAPSLVYYIK